MKNLYLILFAVVLLFSFLSCSTDEKSSKTATWVYNRSYDIGGSGDGLFNLVTGIAVDLYHNIYISDINNNQIQKLTENAEYITKWGVSGTGNGEFDWPRNMVIDSVGNVYVADQRNFRIQKFGADGSYISQVGSEGTNPGQFDYIYQLAIDSNDNIFVVDVLNKRIQKFNSNLAFISLWTNTYTTGIQGIDTDSEDNIYVLLQSPDNSTYAMIVKYDNTGNYIDSWSFRGSSEGSVTPGAFAIDSEDRIHAVIDGTKFFIFNTEGDQLLTWGNDEYTEGQFDSISEIAFDDEDNLYIIDIITNNEDTLHIFEKVLN